MEDYKNNFIDELTERVNELKAELDPETFKQLIEWGRVEYANFMLIPRETYVDTLNKAVDMDNSDSEKKFFQMFLDNIDKYAATQIFYRVMCKFTHEAV